MKGEWPQADVRSCSVVADANHAAVHVEVNVQHLTPLRQTTATASEQRQAAGDVLQ